MKRTIICKNCGKEKITCFTKTEFCSRTCRSKYRHLNLKYDLRQEVAICKGCKVEFKYYKAKRIRKYCSESCRRKHADGSCNSYIIKAFKNYPHSCNVCGNDDIYVLCVHHKDLDRKNNNVENLEILCANCHIKKHTNGTKNKIDIINRIKKHLNGDTAPTFNTLWYPMRGA